MAQSYYKFKPYKPLKLGKKTTTTDGDLDKQIKSLEKQRENLNKRLEAEGIDPETLGGEFDNRNLLEKALNLPADQGLLMDFFEVIDRPVQAVKGAILAGKKGSSVATGFVEGLAGNSEVTGADFIRETTGFEAQTGVGKFATNIFTDIALDPLTYLPPGILAKGLSKLGSVGSKTFTKEVVEAATRSAVKESADNFAKSVVEAAQAIVDDVARADVTDIDTAIKEVLLNRGDATGNVRNIYLIEDALDEMSVQQIAKGIQDGNLNETILTQSGKGKKLLKERLVKMSDIKNGKYIPEGAGEAAEIRKYLDIYDKIEGLDPDNVIVVLNKSTDRFDDIGIFYKTKIGNKNALVKVDSIEIKQMTEVVGARGAKKNSEAFFSNIVMNAQDDAQTGLRTIAFGKNTSLSSKMQNIIKTSFKKIKTGYKIKGREVFLDELIALASDALKAKNTTLLNKYNKIIKKVLKDGDEATKQLLKTMYIDIAKESPIGFTFLETGVDAAGKGKGVLVDVSKNLDKFTETFDVMPSSGGLPDAAGRKTKQLRFKTGFSISDGIDVTQFADETETLLGRFRQNPGNTTEVTEIWTLARRAREGEFGETIKKIARAYKSFEIKFKLTFNLTAGFDAKTKALIMKAKGADMFELERRSGILAEIKQQLIKIDPDAGELLGELIEADAKILNGKIVKLKRQMGTSDFADYMFSIIVKGDGDKIPIPAFADDAAQRNFLDKLNGLYRDATGSTDIMFTVKKGPTGGTVLAFAGDASEMKDLIKYIADPANIRNVDDFVTFGEKALSKKARQFLRNNAEQVARYKSLTDEILDDLVNIAGFENLPVELQKQIGYMRHTMTKEAMEGFRKQMPGVLSVYSIPGRNTLSKRNLMGSVQEINAALRDFYGMTGDFFDPNAFNAMEDFIKIASRKMDQKQILDIILTNKGVDGSDLFKVVDNTQLVKAEMSPYDVMFRDFNEDFKSLYENLSPEAQQYMDDFLKNNGFGDGKAIQMNKSAYNVLKGVEKAYFDVPQLAKIYDKFLNMWKGLTLITPGFHMRNLFGNMFNSYAVGMDVVAQSKYLGVAMQELNTFQEIGKKLAKGLDITDAEKVVYETVRGYFERGVSQTHRGIRDLESVMEASAKGAAKPGTLKNTYNNVIRFNFNVAEKMDDVQRYALYRWSLDKTGDGVKAANTVAEALFDYSHLTPFEKSYMKRLFPFYTFMKNNFVFQMKNIFINPKQYARLGRAYKYASEDLAGYSLDDLPDYATENMWIPLPWTVDKNDKDAVAFLKATLPASDFTELVENPFKKGVTSITAPIKLLIEFGAGKDLFTGQPLEAFPGQTSAMPEGTGVLSGIRDRRGNLTISQSPIFIKIMNDLGLRAPINILSAGLDIVDTLAGYQGGVENLGDFLQRAGIAGVSEMDRLKLSKLYQDLEKLRELKKFYEQETGNQLPVLPRG